MTRDEATYHGVKLYLESYRSEEVQLFETLWLAARDHLDSLLERPGTLANVFGPQLGLDEQVLDWQTPFILAMFSALFSRLPLGTSHERAEVARVLQDARKQCGAHELLEHQLLPIAMQIYALNPSDACDELPDLEDYYLINTHEGWTYAECSLSEGQMMIDKMMSDDPSYDVMVRIQKTGEADWYAGGRHDMLRIGGTRLVVTILERRAASYGELDKAIHLEPKEFEASNPKGRVQRTLERMPNELSELFEPVRGFGYRVADGLRFCVLRHALRRLSDRAASR